MERLMLVMWVVTGCSPRAPTGGGGGGGGGGGDSIPIAGHVLYVPAGFTVNSFAQNVGGVRFLALGPGGAVYATQSGSGQIVRLVDANGDGVAESIAPVLTGLSDPSGIAFRGDSLYFAQVTAVKRLDPGAVTPLTVQAHSAPLGLTFYTGTKFPAEYQGDAFMTYHGSWNRSVPTGAKVVRVRVQNGRPNAVEDFVTGWQLSDGSRWGRPVAVVTAADGALLISDDAGGRIWRVSYGR